MCHSDGRVVLRKNSSDAAVAESYLRLFHLSQSDTQISLQNKKMAGRDVTGPPIVRVDRLGLEEELQSQLNLSRTTGAHEGAAGVWGGRGRTER